MVALVPPNDAVQIANSPLIKGELGVIALRDLSPGETVGMVTGDTIADQYDEEHQTGPRWIALDNKLWIDPSPTSIAYYINHCCRPNAIIADDLSIRAAGRIRAGDEVTIDYSWNEIDPHWHMNCGCGVAECRKQIRSILYMDPVAFSLARNKIRTPLRNAKEWFDVNGKVD